MTTPADAVPVPGPDTPTWTVDEEGFREHGEIIDPNGYRITARDFRLTDAEFAALAADIVAARVHEGCGPATDTLRRARALAEELADARSVRAASLMWKGRSEGALIQDLLDLLVDGGTDG